MRKNPVWLLTLTTIAVSLSSCVNPQLTEDGCGTNDKIEWIRLFNDKDLSGWDGNERLWSVNEGAIHGETTRENPANGNTFLIWQGGKVRDFELRLRFRIQNGNSGVQYRSKDLGDWRVVGYQAEVVNLPGTPDTLPGNQDNGNSVGFLYEEGGRGEMAYVGDFVVVDKEGKRKVVGKVADRNALIKADYYKNQGWNEYTIIAHGNHLVHMINGFQTMEIIDNGPGGAREGILALQLHAGAPMVVEYKDIRIRRFDDIVRKFNDMGVTGWIIAPDK